jgi:hypothetical protein
MIAQASIGRQLVNRSTAGGPSLSLALTKLSRAWINILHRWSAVPEINWQQAGRPLTTEVLCDVEPHTMYGTDLASKLCTILKKWPQPWGPN